MMQRSRLGVSWGRVGVVGGTVFLPRAILCTTVHIGPMLQQDVQDIGPAPGAGLMQGRIASVVAVIHILAVFLKAVENNILCGQR